MFGQQSTIIIIYILGLSNNLLSVQVYLVCKWCIVVKFCLKSANHKLVVCFYCL